MDTFIIKSILKNINKCRKNVKNNYGQIVHYVLDIALISLCHSKYVYHFTILNIIFFNNYYAKIQNSKYILSLNNNN